MPVTNPVDVLTPVARRITGLPAGSSARIGSVPLLSWPEAAQPVFTREQARRHRPPGHARRLRGDPGQGLHELRRGRGHDAPARGRAAGPARHPVRLDGDAGDARARGRCALDALRGGTDRSATGGAPRGWTPRRSPACRPPPARCARWPRRSGADGPGPGRPVDRRRGRVSGRRRPGRRGARRRPWPGARRPGAGRSPRRSGSRRSPGKGGPGSRGRPAAAWPPPPARS